jgi:UDP-N-acetylmuramate: L-alanyl-gamma-D-glutamyl-meso-diaminopimelate ligase
LIVNNIEYDHADIFSDVDAILWQFHQLLRTVPGNGLIVANGKDANIEKLLKRGVWTPVATFSASDHAARWFGVYDLVGIESRFSIFEEGAARGSGRWSLLGLHNLENALAAIAAARHVGVDLETALQALAQFKGVKRRLELRGSFAGITLYEDFAHHPTAIAMTLQGVRSLAPQRRIVAVMEPRSNTMRMGVHRDTLRLIRCGGSSFRARGLGLGLRSQRGSGAARRPARRCRRRAIVAEAAARGSHGRRSRRADVERQLPGLAAAAGAGARSPRRYLRRRRAPLNVR